MELRGFRFSAAPSRQKPWERDDLALICSDRDASVAGVFTRNAFTAAPVEVTRERVRAGVARAVVINAGNANAITGKQGLEDARWMCESVASALEVPPEHVLVASTGVIGQRLNTDGMRDALPGLVRDLDPSHLPKVSRAIMTTDTVSKTASVEGSYRGTRFHVAGVAKGAGMIRPDMATMLCFVLCDLGIRPEPLREILRDSVDASFHRINVDGDTSTNDMVLFLANGAVGGPVLERLSADSDDVVRAFGSVCVDLAKQIVMDAEGATKFIEILVRGAGSDTEASVAAHTIAESKLVKTAFFGEDPNWGRILAALGRSGAVFAPERVDLTMGDALLVRDGAYMGKEAEQAAAEALKNRRVTVTVDLKQGPGAYHVYTSDLSVDYVRINADYRS